MEQWRACLDTCANLPPIYLSSKDYGDMQNELTGVQKKIEQVDFQACVLARVCVCVWEREREGVTERGGERQAEREREIDRERYREIEVEIERKRDR